MQTQIEKIVKVDEKRREVRLTSRVPVDLAKALKHLAVDKNTSVNALVIQALKEFLKTHSRK
jgi:predicted HicB family RNase H-like nuclease